MRAGLSKNLIVRPLIAEEQSEADALFLSIGDGAFVTDAHGRISRINQTALDILGYKQKELLGKWFPDAVIAENASGEVLGNLERPIGQVFLTGRTISAKTYYRRKDGSRVPVSLTVSPVLRNSQPVGAIEVFRDITKDLELEQAKDDFISIASHQLRTPATAVKQYTGMLLEGFVGKLSAAQRKLLKRAYESNERQLLIIDDLLRVARLDAGNIILNIETVDITTMVADIVDEQSKRAAEKQIDISLDSSSDGLAVNIDAERMRMAIENMVDNAIKYTPSGKRINVKVHRLANSVEVSVSDEGVGIAPPDVKRLFGKFTRIDNPLSIEAGGTGLGLYWAEKIVRLHGGRIKVRSAVHKGSTFSLRLPMARRFFSIKG